MFSCYAITSYTDETILSSHLLFLEDTCSTAVPLVDGQTHVQDEHITRIEQRLGRWNL